MKNKATKFLNVLFVFSCIVILPSPKSDQSAMTSSVKHCRQSVIRWGNAAREVLFPAKLHVNLPACSTHCPFNAERQAGKL